MTRRPCVSLTRLRKLQFHWKGSADVTYESFAAATVTVRHVESKITRNQDCFSRYVKDVCTRFAYRQPVTVFPLGGYVARSFYFFFFCFGYRRGRTKFEAPVLERRERANDRIVAKRKNGMEIMPMPVSTMRAFSVLYADDL